MLYTMICSMLKTEEVYYQKFIPALQDAIQEAYDLEVKAWETLMKV